MCGAARRRLDANVLYPRPLRDTLLRVAETELYGVYWSERILDEVTRNLVADGRATDEQSRRLTDAMTAAFEGAAVPQDAIDHIEPGMTNEPEDRHVLAAAVAARADAVITLNLKDFPADACEPLGIDVLHPDTLLLHLHALDPAEVCVAIERQAAALRRPPLSLPELLDRLAVTVPRFAATLRKAQ